jgi:plasmanylethanolamine desaturase
MAEECLMQVASVLCAWLLADFFTGVFHWWEDRCLMVPNPNPVLEDLRRNNEIHHDDPMEITRDSYWGNIKQSTYIAVPISGALFLMGTPTVVWLTALFMALGNLIHRFAHVPKKDIPRVVLRAQKVGLLCSYAHHRKHHYDRDGIVSKERASIHYCVMTNWLNPILDRTGFFPFLERLFGKTA